MSKKRLIIQAVPGEPEIDRSLRYCEVVGYWVAEIIVKSECYEDQFEIEPEEAMELDELMDIMLDKIDEIDTSEAVEVGYRIFQLKKVSADCMT